MRIGTFCPKDLQLEWISKSKWECFQAASGLNKSVQGPVMLDGNGKSAVAPDVQGLKDWRLSYALLSSRLDNLSSGNRHIHYSGDDGVR